MRWGSDGWPLYRLLMRETVLTVRRTAGRLTAPPDILARARVTGLVIAPHDLRTSDATFADDIYSGLFVFAGRSLAVSGRSPFDYAPPSPEFAEILYGFGWLRHLRAADTALARANARAFVSDFLSGRGDPVYARPVPVTARRLIAFLCQSPLVLEGADHAFYQAFLKAIGRTARDLERSLRQAEARTSRLLAAVALCYAGLCCEGLEPILRGATRTLTRELERQIWPDGGHRSRDPRFAMELLLDLLPLRQSFLSRNLEPPEALLRAIDRMLPHLRMLRQGDASLSHFNGMGATAADHLATLLVYGGATAQPMRHAPHSGYERMESDRLVVVADVGAPPRLKYSTHVCAGCLSFEMSSGVQRIVVNCGMPASGAERRMAARSTAAHSTATIANTSSCRFLGAGEPGLIARTVSRRLLARWGPIIVHGPGPVPLERTSERNAVVMAARHDGYLRDFGVIHERRWRLVGSEGRLEGEDAFPREGRVRGRPQEVAIRFHLHPSVRVGAEGSGRLALATPRGETWLFSAEGAEIKVEESVYFAGTVGASRSEQIVLYLTLTEGAGARWLFERQDAAPAASHV